MNRKEEIKQIAYDFTTSKEDCKKLENRILSLFGVSHRRELLNCKICGSDNIYKYTLGNMIGYANCRECNKDFEI